MGYCHLSSIFICLICLISTLFRVPQPLHFPSACIVPAVYGLFLDFWFVRFVFVYLLSWPCCQILPVTPFTMWIICFIPAGKPTDPVWPAFDSINIFIGLRSSSQLVPQFCTLTLNYKGIRCFVIYLYFSVTCVLCTCSDIHLFFLKFLNSSSLI